MFKAFKDKALELSYYKNFHRSSKQRGSFSLYFFAFFFLTHEKKTKKKT
jgi:hypothetical protein